MKQALAIGDQDLPDALVQKGKKVETAWLHSMRFADELVASGPFGLVRVS